MDNKLNRNSKVTLHQQIADTIKEKISSGEYEVGDKIPSTRIMAKEFNVNHLTVRQALKQLESKQILVSRIGQGTFVNSLLDQDGKVAVFFIGMNNEFAQAISRSVQLELTALELDYELIDCLNNLENIKKNYKKILGDEFNGAIIIEPSNSPQAMLSTLQLIVNNCPVVLVDHHFEDVPCCCVESDNVFGGYLATKHLIDQGKKHIAFVSRSKCSSTNDRLEGFRKAIAESDVVSYNSKLVIHQTEDISEHLITEELLKLKPRPDGIFYENDFRAMEGIKVILNNGLRVPEDIAVVGFDDLSFGQFITPALTTINQNTMEIGRQAAKLYNKLLHLPKDERNTQSIIKIPVKIVKRASS